MILLKENLYLALQFYIREEAKLYKDFQSGLSQGFKEIIKAIKNGERIEVR